MVKAIKQRFFYLLVIVDFFLIITSIMLAFILRLSLHDFVNDIFYVASAPVMGIMYLTILYIMGTYDLQIKFKSIKYLAQYTISFLIIAISSILLFYAIPQITYGRGLLAIYLFLTYVVLFLWRIFFDTYIHKIEQRRIAIVGSETESHEIKSLVDFSPYMTFVGYIQKSKNKKEHKNTLGNTSDICKLVKKNNLDCIVVTKSFESKDFERKVMDLKMKGLCIYNAPIIFEQVAEKLPIRYLNDFWIIFNTFSGIAENIYNKRIKRLFDISMSFVGLIVTFPLMLATAFIIKVTSKGPLFYKQTRVGYDEHLFTIIKFRSMRHDAEKQTGAVWSEENDPRITKFGKLIRKLRIDELPQLWNILKGEMAFVGPRPERPEFVKDLKKEIPYYSLRHTVKPGVTGWAQVNYPYGASIEDAIEKLQYDLYYIRHLSLRIDLRVFLRTFRVVLFGIGAR